MNWTKFIALLLGILANSSHAQGTFNIGFEGPPMLQPGTSRITIEYSEMGMAFTSINGAGFGRRSGGFSGYPINGGTYLSAFLGADLTFNLQSGGTFGLESVDLAEYSTVRPDPLTFTFYGYRQDGSVVTDSFTTDGIIDGTGPVQDFQIFQFGPHFTGVVRVELPSYGWSLDNLAVSVVPEPSTKVFGLLAGLLGMGFVFFTKRKPR